MFSVEKAFKWHDGFFSEKYTDNDSFRKFGGLTWVRNRN